MTDLQNPFSGRIQSMQEVTEDKNKQSLALLLGVCRSAKRTLLSVQQSVPNSSMPALWQSKLDAARKEFLAFAQQAGMTRADAETALARELGEPQEASNNNGRAGRV